MSDESLFREVDEEVRQEQFKKLWARYGNLIMGLCLLVIAGVAGFQGWTYWKLKQAQAARVAAQAAGVEDFDRIHQQGNVGRNIRFWGPVTAGLFAVFQLAFIILDAGQ